MDLKENQTQICHRFFQTIGLLSWLSLCFNHLDFQPSGNAGLQYPHSTLKEPPSPLKFMINFFQCNFFSYSLQKLTLAFLPPPLVVVVLSLIYMNELHCTKCMNRRKKVPPLPPPSPPFCRLRIWTHFWNFKLPYVPIKNIADTSSTSCSNEV